MPCPELVLLIPKMRKERLRPTHRRTAMSRRIRILELREIRLEGWTHMPAWC